MVNPKYPPRKGDHKIPLRTLGFKTSRLNEARNKVPYKGTGGKKPPKPPRRGPCSLSIVLVLSLALGAHVSILGSAIAYMVS